MTFAPAWVSPFIGSPYSDDGKAPGTFNCWTLFAHALKTGFGFDIADYNGPVWAGRDGVEAMAEAAEAFARRFTIVATGDAWRAGAHLEQPGDAVLLRLSGHPVHIGLVVAKGLMLHTNSSIDACVERYGAPLWRRRIEAFYRPS